MSNNGHSEGENPPKADSTRPPGRKRATKSVPTAPNDPESNAEGAEAAGSRTDERANRVAELDQQLAKQRTRAERAKLKLEETRRRLREAAGFEGQAVSAAKRVAVLETKIMERDQLIESLSAEARQSASRLKNAEARLESRAKKLAEQASELSALKQQVQRASAKFEGQLRSAAAKAADLEAMVLERNQLIEALSEKARTAASQLKITESKLESRTKKLTEQAAELNALRQRKLPRREEIYDVSHSLPHQRPYPRIYKEKSPLLETFRGKVLEWLARPSGDEFLACECGVYKGHSLVACANVARDLGANARFIGLDSFSGLPQLNARDIELAPPNAPYLKEQLFSDAALDEVAASIEAAALSSRITLVKGFFSETLPTLPEARYDFVNIDCDLFEPHRECLSYFYGRMRAGGVIFFDDYHSFDFPMARAAIDEFLADKPEILFHLRHGEDFENHTKSYIVKS